MGFSNLEIQAIKRSKESVTWFLKNFAKLKHPSAGIMPFYPFSYQRKAIKAFRKHRLNIFRKCRQCFRGDQMVWTPIGPKRIDSIKIGDLVYSFNEDTGRLDIVPVQEVYDNGEMEVCTVESKTGHRSVSTLDHNYFTYRGEIEAQNLTTEDRLIEVNDWPRVGVVADKSEAILLGYLIADGYYGECNSEQVHFTNTTWRYLLEFQKHYYKFFNYRRPIKPHSRDDDGNITSYRIYHNNKTTKQWLTDLGIYGQVRENKTIPDIVFKWDNDSIALFLNRLFAADGWYSGGNCNEVGIGQESLRLLHQIKQLLSRFNIKSKVYEATDENMPKLRILGGKNFQLFVENIGIFNKEPRKEITKGFFFNRKDGEIKQVTQNGEKAKVYDLLVPPHNNYIVDGAVVHNSGISKVSGAFALWFAMFHSNKTILVVSRTNDDAMGFLRENIVFLFENLPEWMREAWKPIKQNEHEIMFPNGSRVKSLTSHPDVLRSNASSLNIIDEAAFIQGMDVMWAGGWPCTRYNTLIQTSEGLIEVGDLASNGDPWVDHNILVATDSGLKLSDKAYNSGLTPTKIISTNLGYELEGTYHHRVRSISESGDYIWSRLDELRPDDIVVSIPGQHMGVRQKIGDYDLDVKFAEILGLYVGDGSISLERPKRFKIVFDYLDKDTRSRMVDQFNNIGFNLPTQAYEEDEFDTANLRLNSSEFIKLMQDNGLVSKTKPQDATIPKKILRSDSEVVCGFLRGLFDSDGWCYQSSTSLKLGFSTTSERLSEQVQIVLHSLGIISRRHLVENNDIPDKNDMRYSDEPYWRLDIWDCKSKQIFKKKIGFLSDRKQKCLDAFDSEKGHAEIDHPVLVGEFAQAVLDKMVTGSFRECKDSRKWNLYRIRRIGVIRLDLVKELSNEFGLSDRLSKYVNNGFMFDTVSSIRNNETETFDISVPDNNTYLANGIVNHNTLQHGGNVIVISTTNGVGGWYCSTMTEAEAGINQFNPIVVNWWDMDWAIEYRDPLSLENKRIAPIDNIRKCKTKEEIEKYGPYWSPWLEEQYKALQTQGEAWKFHQEILASFIGSGNTILSKSALNNASLYVRDPEEEPEGLIVTGYQTYVHPVDGSTEEISFDFSEPDEGFWIWKKPVAATAMKKKGSIVVDGGSSAHVYVMGVDIATGKGRDYSAIEVLDINTMEQVAEFMARCLPREFVKFIDRIGRYYNSALAVVERNNGGDIVIDQLRYDLMYPRLWRQKDINDKPKPSNGGSQRQRALQVKPYGWNTTSSSKPILNKLLLDHIREDDGGYTIYSKRLLKQLHTYVRKRDRLGRDTGKTEAEEGAGNFDDLVLALAMALRGTSESYISDAGNMMPLGSGSDFSSQSGPVIFSDAERISLQEKYVDIGGASLLMPMIMSPEDVPERSISRHIDNYTMQLGAIPMSQGRPIVVPQKFFYTKR